MKLYNIKFQNINFYLETWNKYIIGVLTSLGSANPIFWNSRSNSLTLRAYQHSNVSVNFTKSNPGRFKNQSWNQTVWK